MHRYSSSQQQQQNQPRVIAIAATRSGVSVVAHAAMALISGLITVYLHYVLF